MTEAQLKASILQEAVMGRLVPQDSAEERAAALLKRVRAEKKRLVKAGKVKAAKHTSEIFRRNGSVYEKADGKERCIDGEVPFEIPESWEWVRLGEVCDIINGFTPLRSNTDFWKDPTIPWFTVDDIHLQGRRIYETKQAISSKALSSNSSRVLPPKTVLLCCTASVGEFAITEIPLTTNQQFNGLVVKDIFRDCLSPEFLFRVSEMFKPILIRMAGKTTFNFISVKKVASIFLPLPPLAEQRRIVSKLEELLPLVSEYGQKERALTALDAAFPAAMKKSLLQEAVMGRLVPQDPADEPVAALLKRIRAEKRRLVKAGKVKAAKHTSEIFRRNGSVYEKTDGKERCIDSEVPFEIPESWEWVRLGEVVQVNPRNVLPDDTDVGFIPMAMIDEGFSSHHSYETRKWSDVKSGFTHFKNNDVVIAKITPCFQNRKSAVIADLPNGYGAGTTELHVLRDDTNLLYMPYLLLFCKTNGFIAAGVKHFTGTAGQQRVGKSFVESCLLPLPPLAEQRRIVAKLEEVLPLLAASRYLPLPLPA